MDRIVLVLKQIGADFVLKEILGHKMLVSGEALLVCKVGLARPEEQDKLV